MKKKETKINIIQTITSPLGFFVLALLIVESFLGTVLIFSNLSESHKFFGMIIGIVLFVFVVVVVWLLVFFKAENLIFSEQSHLEMLKIQKGLDEKKIWGTKEKPRKRKEIEKDMIPIEPKI